MSKVRIAIVGCGGIANQKHMPSLAKFPEKAEMVAFCDIIPERAQKAAEEYGVEGAKVYTDYKEMLADKQILARILKYSLEEFANEELSDIIDSMNEPDVSNVRMEPGFTNSEQVMRTVEEDSVIGEGAIYYDDLKAVRSIWICMDSADDGDS